MNDEKKRPIVEAREQTIIGGHMITDAFADRVVDGLLSPKILSSEKFKDAVRVAGKQIDIYRGTNLLPHKPCPLESLTAEELAAWDTGTEELANLIIHALIKEKVINSDRLELALAIAKEEINVIKVMDVY